MLTYFRIATRLMVNYCNKFKTRAHSQRALMESNGSANEPHEKFWINKRRTGSGKCAATTEPKNSTNELLEKNWINKRRAGSERCAAMPKSTDSANEPLKNKTGSTKEEPARRDVQL